MLAVYLHGFILSAAMILPLGPQMFCDESGDQASASFDERIPLCSQ